MKHLATALIGLSMNTLAFAAPTIHLECYEHVDHGHDSGTHQLFSGTIPLGKLRLHSIADKSNSKVYFLNFSANGLTGCNLDANDYMRSGDSCEPSDKWQAKAKGQEMPDPVQAQDQCPQLDPVQWQVQTPAQSQDQSCQQDLAQCQAPSAPEQDQFYQQGQTQCQAPAPCQGSFQCEIQPEQQSQAQCQDQYQEKGSDQFLAVPRGKNDCSPCLNTSVADIAHIDLFSHETLVDCSHHSAGSVSVGETRSFSITHHRGLLGRKVTTTCNVTYNGND